LGVSVCFSERMIGAMALKIATFNVNGIRARLPILLEWLEACGPDVACLQEIKCQEESFPFDALVRAGYIATVRGQKSFNGVAILTRQAPSAILREFDDNDPDVEARLLAVSIQGVWVVNTYVPQGRDPAHPAFQHKLGFFERMKRWFGRHFSPAQPILWAGDLNVAPEEIDVFDPLRMAGKVGFHPAERQALADVASWGFVDLFRKLHPGVQQFTFWDYRIAVSFKKNLGWRLDFLMATESLARACLDCQVDVVPRGLPTPSDHTPVWAAFDLDRI
jgi:exodeoxyribonuclease III